MPSVSNLYSSPCRPRSSTWSKSSNPVRLSWDHPWWIQPSTYFSSKWRQNWNRLKTNWSKPKMNWVPGNLHLIGKLKITPPPNKSQDFPDSPPHFLHCRSADNGGGRLKCYVPSKTQTKTRKTFFSLVLCCQLSYRNVKVKVNRNWKDSFGQVTLLFQLSLPHTPLMVQRPEGIGTVPEEVVTAETTPPSSPNIPC